MMRERCTAVSRVATWCYAVAGIDRQCVSLGGTEAHHVTVSAASVGLFVTTRIIIVVGTSDNEV